MSQPIPSTLPPLPQLSPAEYGLWCALAGWPNASPWSIKALEALFNSDASALISAMDQLAAQGLLRWVRKTDETTGQFWEVCFVFKPTEQLGFAALAQTYAAALHGPTNRPWAWHQVGCMDTQKTESEGKK